jgi:quinol-cytochrome oxidoreductase complex cytochrome b subunit
MVTPAHIVPEWYFLPFYAILRSIPNKLCGVLAMFGALILLFFLPWLDSSKVRSATYRPLFKKAFWLILADCLILGYIGGKPPEGWYVIIGRFATAYYFFHFLVLVPLIARIEKPLPLPESIDAAGGRR